MDCQYDRPVHCSMIITVSLTKGLPRRCQACYSSHAQDDLAINSNRKSIIASWMKGVPSRWRCMIIVRIYSQYRTRTYTAWWKVFPVGGGGTYVCSDDHATWSSNGDIIAGTHSIERWWRGDSLSLLEPFVIITTISLNFKSPQVAAGDHIIL